MYQRTSLHNLPSCDLTYPSKKSLLKMIFPPFSRLVGSVIVSCRFLANLLAPSRSTHLAPPSVQIHKSAKLGKSIRKHRWLHVIACSRGVVVFCLLENRYVWPFGGEHMTKRCMFIKQQEAGHWRNQQNVVKIMLYSVSFNISPPKIDMLTHTKRSILT